MSAHTGAVVTFRAAVHIKNIREKNVLREQAIAEGEALAARAPIDLRVNRLKASRDAVLNDLDHLQPEQGPWSPDASAQTRRNWSLFEKMSAPPP